MIQDVVERKKEEGRKEEESIYMNRVPFRFAYVSGPCRSALLYDLIIAKKVVSVNKRIRIFHTQNDLLLKEITILHLNIQFPI